MTSIDELTAEVARLTAALEDQTRYYKTCVHERDAALAEVAKLRGELAEANRLHKAETSNAMGALARLREEVAHSDELTAELAISRTRDAQQIRQEGAATAGTGKDDPIRFGAPGESPSPPLGDSPHARDAAMPGFDGAYCSAHVCPPGLCPGICGKRYRRFVGKHQLGAECELALDHCGTCGSLQDDAGSRTRDAATPGGNFCFDCGDRDFGAPGCGHGGRGDAAMPGFDARSTAMGMYHATQAQEDDTAEALQRAFDAGRRTRDSGGEERAAAKCKNAPCPVCGDGPSGEWSEGSVVKCDGCGTDLVVDGCEPCLGSSWFSILGGKCPDCDGSGNAVKDDDDSPPCKPCGGEGYRELTVAEARAVAGLAAAAPPATREAALPTKETKR